MEKHALIEELKRLIDSKSYYLAWQLLVTNGEDVAPSNGDSCMLGILILEKLNKYDKALTRAQAWLVNEPNNAYIMRMSGMLLDKLGRYSDAIQQLLKAEQLLPNPKYAQKIIELRNKCGAEPEAQQKTKQNIRRPRLPNIKIFADWSDALAFGLWCAEIILFAIFFIIPYWDLENIIHHPTHKLVADTLMLLSNIKLSTHTLWILFLIFITVIAGVVVQKRICSPLQGEEVVFDGTRRIWSYHWRWLFFLMFIAASNYIQHENFHQNQYVENILAVVGLIVVALGIQCLWLFLPGARTRVQLIRTPSNKSNRLIVTSGVIFQSMQTYLPQMVTVAQTKESALWLLTFTGEVNIILANKQTLNLIGPGSILETRLLPNKINTAINDAKNILGGNSMTFAEIN